MLSGLTCNILKGIFQIFLTNLSHFEENYCVLKNLPKYCIFFVSSRENFQ